MIKPASTLALVLAAGLVACGSSGNTSTFDASTGDDTMGDGGSGDDGGSSDALLFESGEAGGCAAPDMR